MKLVAAAKVRRAQSAVLGARPFSENLVKVLYAVNSRLAGEDVEDHPLSSVRPVKSARFPNLASCPLFGLCRPDGRCTARSASCTSRARSAPSRSRTAPQLRANSLDADSRRLAMLFAPSPPTGPPRRPLRRPRPVRRLQQLRHQDGVSRRSIHRPATCAPVSNALLPRDLTRALLPTDRGPYQGVGGAGRQGEARDHWQEVQ